MSDQRFNDIFEVAGRKIGVGAPCLLVAEIGINHNGDMDLARESIEAAAKAGADAVKFQNFQTEDFVSDRQLEFTYTSQGKKVTEPQYDMFKRCELSRDDLGALKAHCDKLGILFQSTPTSRQGIDDLVAIGTPFLKNGSDYLGHVELIRTMGETGLPTVLSTGMATVSDVDNAVRAFAETGNRDLMLLHCTSAYPTPPEDVNLARIGTLARTFGCPAGFSDHTNGELAAALSINFGACLIEKHFTLSHDLPGPDHWFSMTPAELETLVKSVRAAEIMAGTSQLLPTASEEVGRRDYRLSCVAADALDAGHRLTRQDIAYRRPGHGVPPVQVDLIEGRELARAVPRGHVFSPGDFT